jgi:hypothetical protein
MLPNGTIIGGDVIKHSSKKRSQILGGVLGTVTGLIIAGLVFFFLRRRRRREGSEAEEFEEPVQSPSLIEISPTNAITIAPFNTGSSNKTQLMMIHDDVGPSPVSPSSASGSRVADGMSVHSDSSQPRLVPQRAAHLHVTNLAPGEEKLLPSPVMSRLQPERRQTEGQDQILRREVEQLRMEMDAMRVRQQLQPQPQVAEEPPPGYAES